jgi:hypothetical protein
MKFDLKKKAKQMGAFVAVGAVLTGLGLFASPGPAKASDHDDGETNIKSRNLNLTDLFVFRQDWETGVAGDASKLVMIMDTNPRSLPRDQYFFNTNAKYNIHVGRQTANTNNVTGQEDMRFEFSFAAPDTHGQQAFTLNEYTFTGGNVSTLTALGTTGETTPAAPLLGNPNPTPVTNTMGVASVFAGLREDPFFFDVESFVRVRAALAGAAGPQGQAAFKDPGTAQDFAQGYNVNAIVMSVPIVALQSTALETTFDVWETITIPPSLATFQ